MDSEKKSNGAFVGLAVIVIILIVGGVYIWMSNSNAPIVAPAAQSDTVTDQDSADLNSLELDANALDPNAGVDASTIN